MISLHEKEVKTLNILFFLTPKKDVAYIYENETLRQTLEKMENRRYACVPILSLDGKYIGSISEGDLLWEIKRRGPLSLHAMEDISIMNVPRGHNYKAIHVNSKMENLIHRAMNQNFVPVVDDGNYFIGIVTRKDIIGYCYKQLSDCYLKEGCPKKH